MEREIAGVESLDSGAVTLPPPVQDNLDRLSTFYIGSIRFRSCVRLSA